MPFRIDNPGCSVKNGGERPDCVGRADASLLPALSVKRCTSGRASSLYQLMPREVTFAWNQVRAMMAAMVSVLSIDTPNGPFGTVPELLFEKKG